MKSGFVAIIGRPNAGKSTLLNGILDRKVAIVSERPQTTRNRISGILTLDEAQIVFLDTPGIHKPKHKMGRYMVDIAKNTLSDVDIIYYVVDASVPFGGGENFVLERIREVKTPIFLILNKLDLLEKEDAVNLINEWKLRAEFAEIFFISALKMENTGDLLKSTIAQLEEGPQYYPEDAVTDQPEQIVISEFIREKILKYTKEEVPHSVAVAIEKMETKKNGVTYINACIYVERNSQKKIVIGKDGIGLKRVGSEARRDIEFLLGTRVFLDLWVKVKDDWRNKDGFLTELGIKTE